MQVSKQSHLLILAQLLLLCSLVAGGNIFESFLKNKNDKKPEEKKELQPATDKPSSDKEWKLQRSSDSANKPPVEPERFDREAEELAQRLNNKHPGQTAFKPSRMDIKSLVAAAEEQERISRDDMRNKPTGESKLPFWRRPQDEQTPVAPPTPEDAAAAEEDEEDDEQDDQYNTGRPQTFLGQNSVEVPKSGDGNQVLVSTRVDSPNAIDKHHIRPNIVYNRQRKDRERQGSKIFSSDFLKNKLKETYQATKDTVATAIVDVPKIVNQATDSLSAFLKLDSRGRLLAMIDQVEEDIKFVRKEYSSFSLSWSPIMEKALNYIGAENLYRLKYDSSDEFDFRLDALNVVAFGYEFMKLMTSWRQNMIVAHQAYKLYLETVKKDLEEASKTEDGSKIVVNEDFMYQLNAIHNYMLVSSWVTFDDETRESSIKLDYLMAVNDDRLRDYEKEYLRSVIVLQEIYEPTVEAFREERKEAVDQLSSAGVATENFEDVNVFFDDFRQALSKNEFKSIDWKVPVQMSDFLERMRLQVEYNPIVYKKPLLRDLMAIKEKYANQQ